MPRCGGRHPTRPPRPDRAEILSNLNDVLHIRLELVGAREDLDEVVTVSRETAVATPPAHPARAAVLSNLSAILQARFQRIGVREDLDEAVAVSREAVETTPPGHPNRAAILSNLGGAVVYEKYMEGSLGVDGGCMGPAWLGRLELAVSFENLIHVTQPGDIR